MVAALLLPPLAAIALESCATRADTKSPATITRPTLPPGQDGKLLAAAAGGDIFSVDELLGAGADVDARASNGTTALMGAAYNGYPRTARLLIARGAQVATKSADGATALHYAASGGDAEIVGELLKAGADPNAKSVDGTTPLMWAARTRSRGRGSSV